MMGVMVDAQQLLNLLALAPRHKPQNTRWPTVRRSRSRLSCALEGLFALQTDSVSIVVRKFRRVESIGFSFPSCRSRKQGRAADRHLAEANGGNVANLVLTLACKLLPAGTNVRIFGQFVHAGTHTHTDTHTHTCLRFVPTRISDHYADTNGHLTLPTERVERRLGEVFAGSSFFFFGGGGLRTESRA